MALLRVGNIPGPSLKDYFRIGHKVKTDTLGALSIVNREYGDIFGFGWPANIVVVFDPQTVADILDDKEKIYIKGAQAQALGAALGNGLATNNDRKSWFRNKMIIAKELNPKSIQEHSPLMHQCMDSALQELEANESRQLEVSQFVKNVMIQITCRSLFGADLQESEIKKIDQIVFELGKVIHYHMFSLFPLPYSIPTKKHQSFFKFKKLLDDFIYKLIESEKSKTYQEGEHQTLLSKVVHAKDPETGEHLSYTEMRDEITTMLIGGYETTANIINWLLVELSRTPDYQDKIYQESLEVDKRVNSIQFKNERPVLFAAIAEALRLYPSFPVISRLNTKEVQVNDHVIPANTNISIPIWSIQRDERYWTNAREFMPERFLDKKAVKRKEFLAFGRGERRCVGEMLAYLEIATILSRLVEKYKFTYVSDSKPLPTLESSMRMSTDFNLEYTER